MCASVAAPARTVIFDAPALHALLAALSRRGYALIGPRRLGSAITYQPIESVDDLPRGWTAEQSAGHYALQRRHDDALFAYGPPSESLKRYLHPPIETLWTATREGGSLHFEPNHHEPGRLAVIGVRPCELAAIARLDDVFLLGAHVDAGYQARRASMFLVAANCVHPTGTCFCASMDTGPRAASHFDLALTELPDATLLVEVGSAAGAEVVGDIECRDASAEDRAAAAAALASAAERMGRDVDTTGLAAHLADALEHPEWDDVARRCLACANCAMACPTCFCHTVDDLTDLSGQHLERRRRWDTCFSGEFAYIHGGSVRPSVRARYRQWLTHKFSWWRAQFGKDGCVGCGRCITWCPAGIDVTEEIGRLRR